MRRSACFFLTLVMSAVTVWCQDLPEIEFEEFVLPNGLEVILHEDHSAPIVSVNVWYHVGSKNEKPGRTGFAHLFEHLMFEGSKNVPEGAFDQWLEAAGGDNNGSTSPDRTNYWENVPSSGLELALYLEADRMAGLLDTVDQKKLDGQRDVVKNERRQGVENQPYGRVNEISLEALYPPNHPYSWPVIGSMEDLSAASVEDVHEFFRKYYAPNNASLTIAGDIDPEKTRELVTKYFASIPPGPPIDRVASWVPRLETTKVINLRDNVSLPRIYMSWHSPGQFRPGDAEMDILASVLASGKNSRLYKKLVYELQVAQDVSAYQESREISGLFHIVVTAKPGHGLDEIQKLVDEELARIRMVAPGSAEVETAVNSWEARFVRRIQSVGGFGGKADLLNRYNVFLGDPGFLQGDFRRYLRVTPEAVRRVAQEFLDPGRRVIVRVTPAGDLRAGDSVAGDRTERPGPGPEPELKLPDFEKFTLGNGLQVLHVKQSELPLIQMNLYINGGWAADPREKPGLASLMSDLQDEGTQNRSALELSEALKSIGTNLGTSSSFDRCSITLNTLRKHLTKSMELFSDVLLNPTFPQEELERKKKEYLARILQERRQPFLNAIKAVFRLIYGEDHPYGQPYTGTGTEESIAAIQRSDLVRYYKEYFHPNNATLVVVGDIERDELADRLQASLDDWERADVPPVAIPEPPMLNESRVYLIHKPNAAQSVIVAGRPGLQRNSPDYYSAVVANTVLGGKFTSRLNSNLREDKGYTYGARSMFMFFKGLGPFALYTQVQTEVTRESLVEIVRELRALSGDRPVSPEELAGTQQYLTLRYPREFETVSQVAAKLGELVMFNLPADTFNRYMPSIRSTTVQSVTSAAEKYLRSDQMYYVIVGDLDKIEVGISELNLGKIRYLDLAGQPVKR